MEQASHNQLREPPCPGENAETNLTNNSNISHDFDSHERRATRVGSRCQQQRVPDTNNRRSRKISLDETCRRAGFIHVGPIPARRADKALHLPPKPLHVPEAGKFANGHALTCEIPSSSTPFSFSSLTSAKL